MPAQTAKANATPTHTKELLEQIISIASDAIISIDHELRIRLFNRGAEAIFGYSAEEVVGRHLDILLPERARTSHAGHVRAFGNSATLARRMGERSTIHGVRKSGEEFPAEAAISHFVIDGRPIYSVVLRDVTEAKRAADMLAKSHADLETRIAERTHALETEMQHREQMQAQLVRTQRMEAFGQLTGGVAHDFNNLLTVVTGNLELLEMRLKDDKDRTILKRALDAAEMGARLTGRLLTFARRRQFEETALNLNALVLGLADLLRRTLGEPIGLTTDLAADPWTVHADASEVENALLNLAINARDAMPKGGRLIIETDNLTLEAEGAGAEARLPAGDYVRLSVSDTGVGMSQDVAQRAFEPFFTTKPPGKGTGLGLSTIYGFVQQSGGAVSIYSEVGHGTTVNILLPRAREHDAAQPLSAQDRSVPPAAGETVLLVEDNPEVRLVTRHRLEHLGYAVQEADSGPAAIALLTAPNAVDIVFSDVVMAGGMSGFDVARWVREHAPAKKVLLTSGYPGEILRGHDNQATQQRILRKPYNRAELARALRHVLEP